HRRITRSGNTSIIRASEALTQMHGEPRAEPFQVACLRIDDLLPEFDNRLDFIKIDVEGAEPLVMRGGRQAIWAHPSVNVGMEWSPGQIQAAGFNVPEFIKDLASMGLKSAEIGSTGLTEIPLEALLSLDYRAGILLTSSK